MKKDYRELLLGCGHARDKRIIPSVSAPGAFQNLTTLDFNLDCKPDIEFDLSRLGILDLPFDDNSFDEIHAYEVLEHVGMQGDVERFFSEFHQYWRVLKPNGYFCATVPWWNSVWAWGDPGHTRVLSPASLVFLSQNQYAEQLGKTPMSDYRSLLGEINFVAVRGERVGEIFSFALRAVK